MIDTVFNLVRKQQKCNKSKRKQTFRLGGRDAPGAPMRVAKKARRAKTVALQRGYFHKKQEFDSFTKP